MEITNNMQCRLCIDQCKHFSFIDSICLSPAGTEYTDAEKDNAVANLSAYLTRIRWEVAAFLDEP